MSFVALHRGEATSLASDVYWLDRDDATRCADAVRLLERLDRVAAARDAELQAARAAALAEGREAGRREAIAEAAPRLAAAWERAALNAAADLDALRSALVALSLEVVRRIAGELGPAAVLAAIAEHAARELLGSAAAVVRVHPEVAAAVRERLVPDRGTDAARPATAVLEVRADPALGLWDCIFETAAGRRLAGLPLQLERLAAAWQASAAVPPVAEAAR